MKYLWRAAVRGVSRPIYIVAQNIQSASARATQHTQVHLEDLTMMQRIDPWDDQQNMTVVHWPQPPPEPLPDLDPPP